MSHAGTHRMRAIDPATQQAAAWFARLRADDVTSADRDAFDGWLREDLEHRAAYEKFERFWSRTGEYAGEPAVARAVGGARRFRQRYLWAAAACVLLVSGAAWFAPRLPSNEGVHETRVGERDTMSLRDGSRITLNTDTRLRIDYSESRRLVHLEHGQAFFQVARDLARPFEVRTRNGLVRALGTEFEVYEQGSQALVTLIEGKVMVSEASADGTLRENGVGRVLKPGELAALKPGRPAEVRAAPISHGTAWLSGKLVFDDEPLEHAVAEANRYSRHKISFADERLKDLRISGVFRAGEPDEFVTAISGYFPVRVNRTDDGQYRLTSSN